MKKHIALEMSTDCKGAKVRFAKVSPMSSSSLGLEGLRAHSNSGQRLTVLPMQSREINHSAGQRNPACIQHSFLRMLAAGTQAGRYIQASHTFTGSPGHAQLYGLQRREATKRQQEQSPGVQAGAGCSKVLQSPVLQSCPIPCSGAQR